MMVVPYSAGAKTNAWRIPLIDQRLVSGAALYSEITGSVCTNPFACMIFLLQAKNIDSEKQLPIPQNFMYIEALWLVLD